MTCLYDIKLSVPLGIRYGTMLIEQNGSIITGEMRILGNKSSFYGRIHENHFSISGTLKSPLRVISYHGNGTMNGRLLTIQLQSEHSNYSLTGELHPDDDSGKSF